MRKRIKRKRAKEIIKYYKGQMLHKNSPYAYGLSERVCLMYCPLEGIELYCKSFGQAKRYLDSIHGVTLGGDKNAPGMSDIPF